MNRIAWTKKKFIITLALCTILAVSTLAALQMYHVTEAALINPHPGLVGWWRFDEGTGTVAVDSSGNRNNGTIFGASWTNGKYGEALSFDGSDYASIVSLNGFDFSQPHTISAWVNPLSIANMFLLGRISDVNYYISFGNNGYLTDWASGSGLDWNTGVSYVAGQWQHFVFVFDGTSKSIYRNGILQASTTQGAQSGSGLYIGRYGGYTNGMWQGGIDEIRIYDRALSASEIQANSKQDPDFSSYVLTNIPIGTTQVITTLSWQGTGSINVTITSPTQTYAENMMSKYQKSVYSTIDGGLSSILNIKRLSILVNPLPFDQSWNITITYDNVSTYQMTVEVEK